jgi:hypothetical protein
MKQAFDVWDEMLNGDIYPYPNYFHNITGLNDYDNFINSAATTQRFRSAPLRPPVRPPAVSTLVPSSVPSFRAPLTLRGVATDSSGMQQYNGLQRCTAHPSRPPARPSRAGCLPRCMAHAHCGAADAPAEFGYYAAFMTQPGMRETLHVGLNATFNNGHACEVGRAGGRAGGRRATGPAAAGERRCRARSDTWRATCNARRVTRSTRRCWRA